MNFSYSTTNPIEVMGIYGISFILFRIVNSAISIFLYQLLSETSTPNQCVSSKENVSQAKGNEKTYDS